MRDSSIAFTGTRKGCRPAQREALQRVLNMLWEDGFRVMHNGACYGADEQAAIDAHNLGFRIEAHPGRHPVPVPAVVKHPCPTGRHPELQRNRIMVEAASLLVACPGRSYEELRSGTWATVRHARKLGVPRVFVWPDGTVTEETC